MTLLAIALLLIPAIVIGLTAGNYFSRYTASVIAVFLTSFTAGTVHSSTGSIESIVAAVIICVAGYSLGSLIPWGKRTSIKVPSGPIQYRYCPNCSTALEHREVDGNMRDACTACDFVHWDNPITVGVIVIPSGDGIILVKRGNNPQKGMWALPGGFGDPNECPNVTAVREAYEEVTIHVELDRLLGVMGTPDCNQTLVFYLAKPVTEEPVANSDALEAKVFPLDELPELAFDTHSKIISDWVASRDSEN